MLFGITLLPILIAVGVAVDYTNASAVQQKLAGTTDAIALASARAYKDVDGRESVGDAFLETNMDNYNSPVTVTNLDVDFDDAAKTVRVTMTADVPTYIMNIAGYDKQTITLTSLVSYEGHVSEPVSLGMVLDVSGSMNWSNKIGTLRTAATHLLDKLDAADPDGIYVRTGLTTYYSSIRNTVTMDWSVDHTRSIIQGLWASGGTRSTAAVSATGGWLIGNSELALHEQQPVHEGEEFNLHRFLIFMTDGDNNYSSDDTLTQAQCDLIKADGIEIYSVAFEAPAGGQALLEYCASSEDHYFDAVDSATFLAAFEEIGDRIEEALIKIIE